MQGTCGLRDDWSEGTVRLLGLYRGERCLFSDRAPARQIDARNLTPRDGAFPKNSDTAVSLGAFLPDFGGTVL